MRASNRLLALVALIGMAGAHPLRAEFPSHLAASGAVELVHHFWTLVSDVST